MSLQNTKKYQNILIKFLEKKKWQHLKLLKNGELTAAVFTMVTLKFIRVFLLF